MNVKALHRTDAASAVDILRSGFDLNKFGSATKKTGMARDFNYHPKGIFLSQDEGANPAQLPPHPWDSKDRGVYIFGTANLNKPLELTSQMDGIFYQKWLSDKYGGKAKAQLTAALLKDGYDGIYVTDLGEIIVFDPDSFPIDKARSIQSYRTYQAWKNPKGQGFKEWLAEQEQ